MADNLNFATTSGSWCYDNDLAKCAIYGRLYDYATALTACPTGWHLPDASAWNTLETAVGGTDIAGTRLKTKSGWESHFGTDGNGTDDYGFSALPGGFYYVMNFYSLGRSGLWWTDAPYGSDAYRRSMDYRYESVYNDSSSQAIGFSVRCLKGATSSSSSVASSSSVVTGTPGTPLIYGGQTYKTTVIGTQTWMAENLNYATAYGSWCYDNDPDKCTTYGRLYDLATALTICPTGWHLPDTTEWNTLESAVGGTATAGTKLKANSALWLVLNTGTDDYGFSALPGGDCVGTAFGHIGYYGYWWTATPYGSFLHDRIMSYSWKYVFHNYALTNGFSVRCLKE